jgi:N6-adenosine-specific RNA methylase IME4
MRKYQIIYADPPWSYKVWSGKGKTAANHYNLMNVKDICNLPIKDIADTNCTLFLWITAPCLPDAFKVIEAWGFIYKTIGFTWVKRNKKNRSWFWGLGYWTRANAELCLIATKGSPKRIASNVHQIVESSIGSHSRKPPEVRERIVKLMGDVTRIELFARDRDELFNEYDGWDLWGNEVSDSIIFTKDETIHYHTIQERL